MRGRSRQASRFTAARCISSAPTVDAGPIIAQAAVPVIAGDTPEALAARVLAAEHQLYPRALSLVASGRARVVGEHVEIDGKPVTGADAMQML